jgi:hypothetical protein
MNEFEKSVRGYAAAGIPQVENAGDNVYIVRWGIEPNIVDGEQQGVKFYARSFKGMPTLGDLVDAMVRVQYTASNELALLRQRDAKADKFAAYNEFVEACKAEAKTLLGSGNEAEAEAESENEGEGE